MYINARNYLLQTTNANYNLLPVTAPSDAVQQRLRKITHIAVQV